MGKPSPATNTSSTVTNRTEIDPQLKAMLMDNVGLAKVLTSGILPHASGSGSGGGGSPYATAYSGGQMAGVDDNGMPVYMNPGAAGGGINGDPANYVNADGTPYVPPTSFTAGFDPAQLEAFAKMEGFGRQNLTSADFGGDVFKRASEYTPGTVTAGNIGAPQIGTQTVGTPQMDTASMAATMAGPTTGYDPTHAASGTFGSIDFNQYMSPTLSQTIDPLKAYFNEMGDRSVASKLSTGIGGSAVRGSNNDLREALVRGEVATQSAPVLAQAYQHAFDTSAGLATADLNRSAETSRFNAGSDNAADSQDMMARLQTALANAGYANSASATNASLKDAAGRTNAGLSLDAAKTNATLAQDTAKTNAGMTFDANRLNVGNALDAAKTNVTTGLAGQGLNMQGAAGMASALSQSQAAKLQQMGVLEGVGAQRRGLAQAKIEDPLRALGIVTGSATGVMPAFSGSTGTTSTTGTGGSSGGVAGAAGGALAGAGVGGAMSTAFMTANPWMWPLLIGGGALAGGFG